MREVCVLTEIELTDRRKIRIYFNKKISSYEENFLVKYEYLD